ncbi:MAG: phage scaffolding protein [Firmicutes bacterium]|nr:phage scaffolding protein [Bacillota bacterium]
MIIEGIKSLLGDELYAQVEAALKGKGKDGKDVDLVIGNDGSFVPADKYNGANSGKTSAENALKAAAEALKAIGGTGDPAKIADDVKNAQTTIANLQATHDAEIKKISKNAALRMALNGKVHDPSDIIGLLDLDKIDVDDTGSLKTDLEGLLKPIKETKAYLFKEESKPGAPDIKGAKPAEPGAPGAPAAKVDGPVVL